MGGGDSTLKRMSTFAQREWPGDKYEKVNSGKTDEVIEENNEGKQVRVEI